MTCPYRKNGRCTALETMVTGDCECAQDCAYIEELLVRLKRSAPSPLLDELLDALEKAVRSTVSVRPDGSLGRCWSEESEEAFGELLGRFEKWKQAGRPYYMSREEITDKA